MVVGSEAGMGGKSVGTRPTSSMLVSISVDLVLGAAVVAGGGGRMPNECDMGI